MALIVIAMISFFIYSMVLFYFASRVFDKYDKRLIIRVAFSLINTTLLLLYLDSSSPYYVFYTLVFLIITLELCIFTKGSLKLCTFVSSALVMHISSTHIFLVVVMSKIFNTFPAMIQMDITMRMQCVIYLSIVLIIYFFIFLKLIPAVHIKRIAHAKTYSSIVCAYSVFCIVFCSIQPFFLITTESYAEQLMLSALCYLLLLSLFYIILLYTSSLVNMTMFKRQSDEAACEYEETLKKKLNIMQSVNIDSLTGLYNREYVFDALKTLHANENLGFCVIYCDINGLKHVNDTYGHPFGDALIKIVADAISHSIRDDDIAARVGGDEIIIILRGCEDNIIDTVITRVNRHIRDGAMFVDFPVNASFGGECVRDGVRKHSLDEILSTADKRMMEDKRKYYAKEGNAL